MFVKSGIQYMVIQCMGVFSTIRYSLHVPQTNCLISAQAPGCSEQEKKACGHAEGWRCYPLIIPDLFGG